MHAQFSDDASGPVARRGRSEDAELIFSFFTEAHQALELLEEYHAGLTRPSDEELRTAIERVISVFKDRLFLALLGKFYVLVLPARCHLRRVRER